MPNLGDYLGHVLSELTIARMQADLEALRVAELYASHPLLRHLPVPHLRLGDVEMDIPVVIHDVEEPRKGESPRGGIDPKALREVLDEVLDRHFRKHEIALSDRERARLDAQVTRRLEEISQPIETAVNIHYLADSLTRETVGMLRELKDREAVDPERLERFRDDLQASARIELLKARTQPPRLQVKATTQEIRESGGPELVVHIKMRVSEEGVEWTRVEEDDESRSFLVPE